MENLLNIKRLTVEYHSQGDVVHAVNGLDLSIRHGESLGLVGETGAGKTTTALSILGLVSTPQGKVVDGAIFFEGVDLTKAKKSYLRYIRGNKISMIFQDPMTSLNPVYSVGFQIAEVIRLHERCSKQEARKKAEEILEMVDIPKERYDEFPHQFSGGMKQRVVIAMSVACAPQLILADEPTTALDVTIQAQVLELMNQLKERLDTSMLLITHDLGVVAQVCDRVAIMYAGEIVEQGTIPEVFNHPAHPYTIGLFGSIPTLDTSSTKLTPIMGQMPDPTDLKIGCSFNPRCPYAREACRQAKPSLVAREGEPGHIVRCIAQSWSDPDPALMEVIRRGR